MPPTVRLACLQVNPGNDLEINTAAALTLARRAVEQGAEFLLTPEHVGFLDGRGSVMRTNVRSEEDHTLVQAFRAFAAETGRWILIGSVNVPAEDGRISNRSLLIDGRGAVVARYDKIHMADLILPSGRGVSETRSYRPGDEARVAATPWGVLGMTVCYDVRFPQLCRSLAQAGAAIIAVPAAFTRTTGRDHWHVLLRARAIETACFVVAPATCGEHPGEHATFGHSLVIDPWGRILAEADDEPEVLIADLDFDAIADARRCFPSVIRDRVYAPPAAPNPCVEPA